MKEERTLMVALVNKGDPIFDKDVWTVEIDDEAGGEFVVVKSQLKELDPGQIYIDPAEWPQLRALIDRMVKDCRDPSEPQSGAKRR